MADSYEVNGVTITPAGGGGYYDLNHSSLPDGTERVQGKEKAEARAAEIGGDNTSSTMQQQGELTPPTDEDKDAQIAALQAQLQVAQAQHAELTKAAEPLVQTVVADATPPASAIPPTVPRQYTGQMDPKTKEALQKAGTEIVTIVLEEGEAIPPTGLFIGHNGRAYVIKPGEEVDVPKFLVDVLDDAIMSSPVVDVSSQKILGYRNRSKYPYRVINRK